MKRVVIVHGWGGNAEESWFPWISNELTKKGFKVTSLSMPHSEHPKIEEWVSYLNKAVDSPGEDTYLIGHSIGCQTIIRWLEGLDSGVRIGGAVFVAGWFTLTGLDTDEEREIAKPWLETKIDFVTVKQHLRKSIAIFSDNDPFVPLRDVSLFEKNLGSKTIIEYGKGHLNGEANVMELESALDAVLELANK